MAERETARSLAAAISRRERSAEEATRAYLDRIAADDADVHAYLSVDREGALAAARDVDRRLAAGEEVGPLAGVPLGVKDVLCIAGWPTTAGSRALEGWRPPYDATAVARLRAAGAVVLGKLNCDEFAMGSSTEHSAYGVTRNPHDLSRVPGGSSGGSAAAVASGTCVAALGTDTGGSVRQPAAFCGVVGFKPTYGRVSRYGLIAMASSLDTVGFLTNDVADAALLLQATAGPDDHDATSATHEVADLIGAVGAATLDGVRLGVPAECFDGVPAEVAQPTEAALAKLESAGATLVPLSLPTLRHALAVYYVLMPAEVSANLARFDGVRYPSASSSFGQAERSFASQVRDWRSAHLGAEVKRRVLIGAYVLSAGFKDAYYRSAIRARRQIRDEVVGALAEVDALVTPTTPTTAFGLGEKLSDPLAMYLGDLFTVPANIAGVPAISLPLARQAGELPVGLQLIGSAWGEAQLLAVAQAASEVVG